MAGFTPKRWHLLCYDISSDRRLRRVHRLVCRQALAVQRSVFLFYGSQADLSRLVASVASLIAVVDDVRFYPVTHPDQIWASRSVMAEAAPAQVDSEPLLFDDRGGDVLDRFHHWTGRYSPRVSDHVARR